MTLAILHLDTDEIVVYGVLSLRSKRVYAERWSLEVVAHRGRLDDSRPPAWSKILLCEQTIHRFDWIWWLDADAGITNMEIDVRTRLDDAYDLIVTCDANGMNSGSFLLRNTLASRRFLSATWNRTEFIDHRWWEQAAMRAVLEDEGIAKVKFIDQRLLNSYPENWLPGDLVIHCPGIQHRLELLRSYVCPPIAKPLPITFPSTSLPVSIDQNHAALLYGATISKKPRRLLELGIGMAYATRILLEGIRYNGIGQITCVDNFGDWGGSIPRHIAELRDEVELIVQDEGRFLRSQENGAYDLVVVDADHVNAGGWAEEYLRISADDAFLFFHDTANPEFPGLGRIVEIVR